MTVEETLDYLRSAYPTGAEVSLADGYIWKHRAEIAEAALAALQAPCVWKHNRELALADRGYDTGCGPWYREVTIEFCSFCPSCGHPIEVQP